MSQFFPFFYIKFTKNCGLQKNSKKKKFQIDLHKTFCTYEHINCALDYIQVKYLEYM